MIKIEIKDEDTKMFIDLVESWYNLDLTAQAEIIVDSIMEQIKSGKKD